MENSIVAVNKPTTMNCVQALIYVVLFSTTLTVLSPKVDRFIETYMTGYELQQLKAR